MGIFSDKKSNVGFMMNGPRLRSGLMEGFENIGGFLGWDFFDTYNGQYRASNLNSTGGRMAQMNMINIQDQMDGRQAIQIPLMYEGDASNSLLRLRCRFAVQSNDPNVYLVVNIFSGINWANPGPYANFLFEQFVYVDLANPYSDFSTAKTVEVTLPLSEWWPARGDEPPTAIARNSTYIYTGRTGTDTGYPNYVWYTTGNSNTANNMSNPATGYVSRSVTSTHVTMKFEFPAGTNIIREQKNGNSPHCVWNVFPINMRGRKLGNAFDQLANTYTTDAQQKTQRVIAKVYSPQKGCLALKSYYNGEIPILNE